MTETSGREKVLEEALPIPPDRQDRFEQITQEVVDRWYIDSGRPQLASSYKIKWPRYDDAAAFENNARALWDELGLHADDKTCIAILAAALERAAVLASPSTQEPALRGGKVEEIARRAAEEIDIKAHTSGGLYFCDLAKDIIAAALRTHAGESAAQSERAGLKRAAEWQPIETAPRDGSIILIDTNPEIESWLPFTARLIKGSYEFPLGTLWIAAPPRALSAARKAGGE